MIDSTPKASLKDAVREKISQSSLTDEQIEMLKARLNPKIKPRKAWSISAMVAGLLLLLGLTLMLHSQWQAWQKEQLVSALAQEVVEDHMQQQPLEFFDRDLAQLNQQLSNLEFTLVNTIQLPDLDHRLLGGRYTSIQGKSAAQLRIQESDAAPSSLYQVAFNAEIFTKLGNINVDEQPLLHYAKGFSVTLWEEKGVFMALVESVHPDLNVELNLELQPLPLTKPDLVAPNQ